jgi:hypothetical protein
LVKDDVVLVAWEELSEGEGFPDLAEASLEEGDNLDASREETDEDAVTEGLKQYLKMKIFLIHPMVTQHSRSWR